MTKATKAKANILAHQVMEAVVAARVDRIVVTTVAHTVAAAITSPEIAAKRTCQDVIAVAEKVIRGSSAAQTLTWTTNHYRRLRHHGPNLVIAQAIEVAVASSSRAIADVVATAEVIVVAVVITTRNAHHTDGTNNRMRRMFRMDTNLNQQKVLKRK